MDPIDRRKFFEHTALAAGGVALAATAGCKDAPAEGATPSAATPAPAPSPPPPLPSVRVSPLGTPWQTLDPFLFCMHHRDAYPKGDARMAPAASLAGRQIGQDFSARDGWSMYHGDVVPGFPRHPHRGFETVTISRSGFIDHADSLGATARYGGGDVQWLTAGGGIVHAEMFPLRDSEADNPLELFQIWLNLPQAHKMVAPYFKMLWREGVPVHRFTDEAGRVTEVITVAGALEGRAPGAPPPDSWAASEDAEVAIWTLNLEPGARWTLPPASPGVTRALYVFRGDALEVAGVSVAPGNRAVIDAQHPAPLVSGAERCEALLLQGRPIGEPVVSYGPFVMNTREEIQQAYADYRRDGFGGWPWPSDAPVHPRARERFAVHADGAEDVPA
ncbi:MAG: pirin [Deltaproteobacteria bacterium HGW-Deltaproteobacteria-14]|jgi:hypothetical protein|nr:MAG: pirin [Deltaproteobacteria bacterium HGW-Deltaproteobacteria-14]